jgi:DDE superfamily endonuclease
MCAALNGQPRAKWGFAFVDETSTHTAMTRRYARAPRGQQAYGAVPRNRGPNLSLIGALGVRGMVAAMTGEGAVDTDTFDICVKRILVPALQPEDIVLLDNLSVYQASGIELAVKAGGTSELSAAVFPGFLTAGAVLVEDKNLLAQLWGKHAPAVRHRRAPSSPTHSAARYFLAGSGTVVIWSYPSENRGK